MKWVLVDRLEPVALCARLACAALRDACGQLAVQLLEADEAAALLVKVAEDERDLGGRETERHDRVAKFLQADPPFVTAHCQQLRVRAALLTDQL